MKSRSHLRLSLLTFVMVAITMAWALSGCYYDKADIVYPNNCDTSNVTYSASVVPILSASCYSCHGGSDANVNASGKGIRLDTYAGASTQAKNNKLPGSIQHLSGYVPMPLGGSKLIDCQINTILIWVKAGAPDN